MPPRHFHPLANSPPRSTMALPRLRKDLRDHPAKRPSAPYGVEGVVAVEAVVVGTP